MGQHVAPAGSSRSLRRNEGKRPRAGGRVRVARFLHRSEERLYQVVSGYPDGVLNWSNGLAQEAPAKVPVNNRDRFVVVEDRGRLGLRRLPRLLRRRHELLQ